MTILYEDLQHTFYNLYGFNLDGIYCSITGKRIGTSNTSELQYVIDSIDSNDHEEIVDDLALRIFASMRPSINWNMLRTDSIADMRVTAPKEVLAYIINRFFYPTKRNDMQSHIRNLENRVRGFRLINEMDVNSGLFGQILHAALKLDSRVALGDEPEKIPAIDLNVHQDILATLESLCNSIMERQTKLMNEAKAVRNNALSGKAYYDSFMQERKNNPKTIAKVKKQKAKAEFANILDDLLSGDSEPIKHHTSGIKTTKMPKRFGVKK